MERGFVLDDLIGNRWCITCGHHLSYDIPGLGVIRLSDQYAGFDPCLMCRLNEIKNNAITRRTSRRDFKIAHEFATYGYVRIGLGHDQIDTIQAWHDPWRPQLTAYVDGNAESARGLINDIVREHFFRRPLLATHVRRDPKFSYVMGHVKDTFDACPSGCPAH